MKPGRIASFASVSVIGVSVVNELSNCLPVRPLTAT